MNQLIIKKGLFIAVITSILFASCTKNDVTGLTLSKATASVTLGQKDSLIAKVAGDGDISKFPVSWTTSNSSVATVAKGKIVGISKGTATITAKAGNVTSTCVVSVVNEIYPVMTKGGFVYFGDTLGTKISNYCEVVIVGPVDTLYFFVNIPLTAKNNLPAGVYKFMTAMNSASDFAPYTIIPGDLYDGYQEFSWYIGSTLQSPIIDGALTVTLTNSIYAYEFNFIDYYGNTIFGTYQGTLRFVDGTISSSPAVKSDLLKIQHLKFSSNKLNFIKGR